MTGIDLADTGRAGQVLLWAPEGAGDFVDVAWVIAEVVGNGPGVRGMWTHSSASGQLHVDLQAANREYVFSCATHLNAETWESKDCASTWCDVHGISVRVTWVDQVASGEGPGLAETGADCVKNAN